MCPKNPDGWHRTLIIKHYIDQPERTVEHTCSCWLPSQMGGDAKILFDSRTPNATGIWSWKDGERKLLESPKWALSEVKC